MSRPAAIATTSARPLTSTGDRRRVRVPSPAWPSAFRPHAQTVPPLHSARVLLWPVSTATTEPPAQGTATWVGVDRFAESPNPSWPSWLLPQV
jgi:hypothetical protein